MNLTSRLLLFLASAMSATFPAMSEVQVKDVKTISVEPGYYIGWSTITARANGDLAVVYSGGRDYHVCPFGRVEIITSRDGGDTWSWPRVILDSATDDRDAGILESHKGTLLVSTFTSLGYQDHMANPAKLLEKRFAGETSKHIARWQQAEQRTSNEQKQADVGTWFVRSEDGGLTWSDRQLAPCNSPHGPIQLRDGRLLYAGKELWTEEKKVGVWDSKDDGKSWNHLADFPVRPNETLTEYHEVHAVEAGDGTIIAHIRNHNGKVRETLQTESKDGGTTWTVPHGIEAFGYPSHLVRLRDNSLLMTYGFRKKPFGIRGKVSRDNGSTWSEEFRLTDDGYNWDIGYPSSVQLADGSLLTVWYEVQKDSPNAVLRQARWTLQ